MFRSAVVHYPGEMPRPILVPGNIPNNTGPFLNGLFADTIRAPREFSLEIDNAIQDENLVAWLITQAELNLMVRHLSAALMNPLAVSILCEEDRELMRFFNGYFAHNNISMSVPALDLVNLGPPPRYQLNGYITQVISSAGVLSQGGVNAFLELLLIGAHFVVLHSLTGGHNILQDFYVQFGNRFYSWTGRWTGAAASTAAVHSHYGVGVRSAYSYPNKWEWLGLSASAAWPLIPIMIVDTTVSRGTNNYNTFFQMEGWSTSILGSFFARNVPALAAGWYAAPAWAGLAVGGLGSALGWPFGESRVSKGGIRHGADFETHMATKWNISTYGACVYSEKRAATVFLHRPGVAPVRQANTVMYNYVGAAPNADATLVV